MSSSQTCVEDFEDERSTYEAIIYGSLFCMILAVGLPIRCGCVPRTIQTSVDRDIYRKFAVVILLATMTPIVVISYALFFVPPKCTCYSEDLCEVCTLRINGIPMGSCHKAARNTGFFGIPLCLLICWSFMKKIYSSGPPNAVGTGGYSGVSEHLSPEAELT